MINFEPKNKAIVDGAYFISRDEIEHNTREILRDYNPNALDKPFLINSEDFILNYLNARDVVYQDLVYEDEVLGITTFGETTINIWKDEERQKGAKLFVKPDTIILNECLLDDRESQFTITALHEAGHLWMHKELYTSFEESLHTDKNICFIDKDIVSNNPKTNGYFRREWQATFFAVCLSLPLDSFSKAVKEVFFEEGIGSQYVTAGIPADDNFAKKELPTIIRDRYYNESISKESIFYRMVNNKFIISEKSYDIELNK